MKIISIKKNNQQYLKQILINYPGIDSGRKNYKAHYNRVLKNILLSKAYELSFKNKKSNFPKKISFKENNKSISIKLII